MDRSAVVSTIEAALQDVLKRDVAGVGESTRLFEDLALDSTSVIELLMGLEDAVALEVDPDTLDPDVFQTIGSLADYVIANLPADAAPAVPAAAAVG
jgi:acyl carrier protein